MIAKLTIIHLCGFVHDPSCLTNIEIKGTTHCFCDTPLVDSMELVCSILVVLLSISIPVWGITVVPLI
ncbi:hypothetical protein DEQ92_01500 [Haloferax sp. Atlit-6N]|nr:hypothetical protein DEQ92_01500 [Haloferax sp. Atlit-6N]